MRLRLQKRPKIIDKRKPHFFRFIFFYDLYTYSETPSVEHDSNVDGETKNKRWNPGIAPRFESCWEKKKRQRTPKFMDLKMKVKYLHFKPKLGNTLSPYFFNVSRGSYWVDYWDYLFNHLSIQLAKFQENVSARIMFYSFLASPWGQRVNGPFCNVNFHKLKLDSTNFFDIFRTAASACIKVNLLPSSKHNRAVHKCLPAEEKFTTNNFECGTLIVRWYAMT